MNRYCLGSAVSGVGFPRITGGLSMRYSGFCEREHPGVTCLQIMGNGEQFISDSYAGAEVAYGKEYLRFLSRIRIMNG